MNKKIWLGVIVVLIVIVGGYILLQSGNKNTENPPPTSATSTVTRFDPLNTTYIVENSPVTLKNGVSIVTIPGTKDPAYSTTVTTKFFGEATIGDLNGDGLPDAAMFLTQDSGGSGTFYYIVVAINTKSGAQGTNAIFLGDRIAPQNVQIKNKQVVANYADRKPTDSFATSPSIGVSKYLVLHGDTLATSTPFAGAGERCGGNMMTAPTCMIGYHCVPEPGSHLPFGDVGGICVVGND